jgi:hypothetical protein
MPRRRTAASPASSWQSVEEDEEDYERGVSGMTGMWGGKEESETDYKVHYQEPASHSQSPQVATAKSTKAVDKVKQKAALTGQNADFPTLGMTQREDVAFNISYVIHSRMVTFKWKQLTWMLRARAAFQRSEMTWKRHPRWLAMMLSKDVASLWGHLGCTTKSLRGVAGPPLFR